MFMFGWSLSCLSSSFHCLRSSCDISCHCLNGWDKEFVNFLLLGKAIITLRKIDVNIIFWMLKREFWNGPRTKVSWHWDRSSNIFVAQDWANRVSHFRERKFFPQNAKFFNFYIIWSKKSPWPGSKNTRVKAKSAPYLLPVRSMIGSGQVMSHHLLYGYIKEYLMFEFCTVNIQSFIHFWWKNTFEGDALPRNWLKWTLKLYM